MTYPSTDPKETAVNQPYQIIVLNHQGFALRTYLAPTKADAQRAADGLRNLNVRHVGRVEIIPPALTVAAR